MRPKDGDREARDLRWLGYLLVSISTAVSCSAIWLLLAHAQHY